MLFADAAPVIQVEWQALAVFGSTVGGALIAAAKIVAGQLQKNSDATTKRHEENRQDAKEARDENRALSQAILAIQRETSANLADVAKNLGSVQRETERVVDRLDRLEKESKQHEPLCPSPETGKGKGR